MRIQRCVSILLFSALIVGAEVYADTISGIEGTTYSVANGFTAGTHPEGSHFHSSNLEDLPPGNPSVPLSGVAEVGGFFGDEEVRGVTEFPLQAAAPQAILEFDVLDLFELGISPEVNGVDTGNRQGNFLWAASFGFAFNRYHGVKIAFLNGRTVEDTGVDYNQVQVGYSFMWGEGL